MGWEVGGRFKRAGTYVYLWLIYVDVWQRPAQYCKALILQLKILKIGLICIVTFLSLLNYSFFLVIFFALKYFSFIYVNLVI